MLKDFSAEEFDIIIQGGQSNSEGAGKGPAEFPYAADWEARDDIYYLNPDFTISAAGERVWGNSTIGDFSLAFSRRYAADNRLKNGRKLLIIRAAMGNTGFSDNRWGEGCDLNLRIGHMIETALGLNPSNRAVCFLWHQGETDVLMDASGADHYKNLLQLVNRVRMKSGNPNLPLITADFVQEWKNVTPSAFPIAEAVKKVCSSAGPAVFLETAGLTSNNEAGFSGDNIHFSRQSLYLLGERMYQAFASLESEEKSAENS